MKGHRVHSSHDWLISNQQELKSPLSLQTFSFFSSCEGEDPPVLDEGGPSPSDHVYPAPTEALDKSTKPASSKFELPGKGVPAIGCGKPVPMFCKTHGGPFWNRSHCLNRECPDCYERWAGREAQRASRRISWGGKYLQTKTDRKLRIPQVMISMPDDFDTVDACRYLAYRIAKRHGIEGGACIFHPWREDLDERRYVPDGYWHFHFVGINFGDIEPGGTDFLPDGRLIVFKHVRDEEYGDFGGLRSQEAVSRLIQYLLTHAGLEDGTHALTYFGNLAYNKLPQDDIEDAESGFPKCLTRGSKTDPARSHTCPVDGSHDVENCIERIPTFAETPALEISDPERISRSYDFVEVETHPEPDCEPTPEVLKDAQVALAIKLSEDMEHGIEDLNERYGVEHWSDIEPKCPAKEYRNEYLKLKKDCQRKRAELASRENEFFNMNNPLVAMWVWIHDCLNCIGGATPIQYLEEQTQNRDLFAKVVELNQRTGRLRITPGGRLVLHHEYDLDDALRELRSIVRHEEPPGDWRLERLLKANPSEDEEFGEPINEILTEMGFVFGPILERYQTQAEATE